MGLLKHRAIGLTFATATSACGGHDMSEHGAAGHEDTGMLPEVMSVPASESPFDLATASDLDPAPDVVEVALEAMVSEVEIAPGRHVSLWTYNGQFPGPEIEARVGDTVRVHFKNSLPEATTIHWHGVRVPAAMDGVPAAQAPIASGAEFMYEFVVPDAGTFWYHPHVRSDEQVERGLYGSFRVRADDEPNTTTDRTVVLDDILVDSEWQLSAFDPMQAMVGRQGNLVLANGWANPIMHVTRGGLHRFRFINAANARYFRLALAGHRLIQIGTDGGLLPAPREVDELLLVPGERADVVVVAAGAANESLALASLQYDRGHGTGAAPDAAVFELKLADDEPSETPSLPATFRPIEPLPEAAVLRELRLEESMAGAHGEGHAEDHGSPMMEMAPVFSINGQVHPDVTPLVATLETVEQWSVVNTTEMDHPFHLHGFRFQIVADDGSPGAPMAWRDSINIPAEKTVVFRVRLEDNPGTWMFHCHILEHAERGMMGELEVARPE